MLDDSRAPHMPLSPALADAEYDTIFATLAATDRGRWFLDEYARRHRGADTDVVLAAIARIERMMHGGSVAEDRHGLLPDSVSRDLAAAVDAVSRARQALGYAGGESADADSAATLRGLIDEIDWRLHSLSEALLPGELAAGEEHQVLARAPPQLADAVSFDELTDTGDEPADSLRADALTRSTASTVEEDALADLTTEAPSSPTAAPHAEEVDAAVGWAVADSETPSEQPTLESWRNLSIATAPEPSDSLFANFPQADHEAAEPEPEPLQIDDVIGKPERLDISPIRAAINALVATEPPTPADEAAAATAAPPDPRAPHSSEDLLFSDPAIPDHSTEGLFDPGLFDVEEHLPAGTSESDQVDSGLLASPQERAADAGTDSAPSELAEHMGHHPQPGQSDWPPHVAPLSAEPETAGGADEDKEAVLLRLQDLRKSIHSLMDEIAEKTGRPIEPPRS
jgi:hypothetical protein